MTRTLTARRLITDTATVEFPVLMLSDDGAITAIHSDPRLLAQETTTLTAAFLDIHIHGTMGHDVMTASPAGLAEMQRFLAAHGVAHYLPTTVTAPIDTTLRALEALANAIEAIEKETEHSTELWKSGARPIGIHLEGPFLSHAKRGVHQAHELQPPSITLFDRFQTAARGHIVLMTIAPELGAPLSEELSPSPDERPGSPASALARWGGDSASGTWVSTELRDTAIDLIRHATSLGVRISLGHSNAIAAEAIAAIAAGATSATHTFNAMRPLDHREPGILGVVLDNDRLYAELICDGIHVAPALVRLWLKAKSTDRAILITDGISATGMPDGDYSLASQPITVANGRAALISDPNTLAGSVLTMNRAVANVQQFTGATLADATRLASHNPAAMLGRPELTSLAPGSPANLNRFDANGRLIATYLHGHQVATG